MALEFCILTAARTGEVLGATWNEFDLDAALWTIPLKRMKAAREHRVPLPARAIEILRLLDVHRTASALEPKACSGDLVFPGQNPHGPMAKMSMWHAAKRIDKNATTHGFRSAFRDWCGNETSFPREVAEAALAHVAGDATEQAYRRGDALEKRRALMAAWASFCEPGAGGNVVQIIRGWA